MKMNKQKTIKLATVGLLTLLLATTIYNVLAADNDDVTLDFQIDSIPAVSAVDFTDDADSPISELDPDATTYYKVAFTVDMPNTLEYIDFVEVFIFEDVQHGADYDSAPADGLYLTEFKWTEATDLWTIEDQGALANWAIDSVGSDDCGTASALTTYDFQMRFQVSEVARYSTSWNVSVHAWDDDTFDVGKDSETALITFNEYFSLVFSTSTGSWGTDIQVDSTDNPLNPDTITITIVSNAQWEVKLQGTDFTPETIDIDLNDIIEWDYDGVAEGGDSFFIRADSATVCSDGYDNQAPSSTEAGDSLDFHVFLNPAQLFTGGQTYSTTITATLQADT